MSKIEFFSKIKAKTSELKSKNKKVFYLSIVLIIAAAFFVFSIAFKTGKKNSEQKSENNQISVSDYASSIEKKLTDMISKLDSVNEVSVFVMVDSTPRIEYLTEKSEEVKQEGESKNSVVSETVVFEKDGSILTPIVVTTIMPKVTGVLIVTNKISASTKISIISSVSVVLNIDRESISLLQEG